MDGWTDRRRDGGMDGWMDGWMMAELQTPWRHALRIQSLAFRGFPACGFRDEPFPFQAQEAKVIKCDAVFQQDSSRIVCQLSRVS